MKPRFNKEGQLETTFMIRKVPITRGENEGKAREIGVLYIQDENGIDLVAIRPPIEDPIRKYKAGYMEKSVKEILSKTQDPIITNLPNGVKIHYQERTKCNHGTTTYYKRT